MAPPTRELLACTGELQSGDRHAIGRYSRVKSWYRIGSKNIVSGQRYLVVLLGFRQRIYRSFDVYVFMLQYSQKSGSSLSK